MIKKCVVVDYGIGNIFSVMQALKNGGADVELTGDPDRVRNAERLILPGVGAFGRAADRLRALGLDEAILDFVRTERPFLGICVGMQLLMEQSFEFGQHQGLGLFKGKVERIQAQEQNGEHVRVPVIGWNSLNEAGEARWVSTPFAAIEPHSAYYFVHSYACCPVSSEEVCATTNVGSGKVVAAIQRDNILGVQFHPERSAESGLAFMAAFLNN